MKVSIITINYNNAHGLRLTIDSVLAQTVKEIEYIVIDGNSTDGSLELLKKFDSEIDYWVSEPDNGIYHAMNKGISVARGEYLLFLNSGDILHNNYVIEKSLPYLQSRDIDLVYGQIDVINGSESFKKDYPEKLSFRYMLNVTLPHPGTYISMRLFDRVGLFNEENRIVSDWEFFITPLSRYNATYQRIDLVISDFDFSGISSDQENMRLILKEKDKVLKDQFPFFIGDYELLDQMLKFRKKIYSSVLYKVYSRLIRLFKPHDNAKM